MTVEVLFDEVCNLNADGRNSEYLQMSMPDAEFIHTKLDDEPYFVRHNPDIIMMGHMTEKTQRFVIDKLMNLKRRLNELIDNGTIFVITGNALDVFCEHISYVTEKIEKDALGIFPLKAKCDLFDRYNGKQLSNFAGTCLSSTDSDIQSISEKSLSADDIKIVGFKSQFSFLYGDNSSFYFSKCVRGVGINRDSSFEGVRKNNFFGTHLCGPLLVLNPLFTEHIMHLAGHNGSAAFRDAAMDAYKQHVREFEDLKTQF